jgi:putative ABC transport system ATP-binding protein
VQVPRSEAGLKGAEREARAAGLLKRVGLAERLDSLPTTLSGGERQRVAIARALVNQPRILSADEPTGAVDSANSAKIIELLRDVSRETGMTLIVVTHDPQVAEQADRVIRVLDGRVVNEAA